MLLPAKRDPSDNINWFKHQSLKFNNFQTPLFFTNLQHYTVIAAQLRWDRRC